MKGERENRSKKKKEYKENRGRERGRIYSTAFISYLSLTHMAPTLSHIRTLCFTQELRPASDLLTLPLTPTALSYPLNTLNE